MSHGFRILLITALAAIPQVSSAQQITELQFESAGSSTELTIATNLARPQLVVSARMTDGSLVDVTRDCELSVADSSIISVDDAGRIVPHADGATTLTATLQEISATLNVTVTGFAAPRSINFGNQIVPVFTRLGCNGGGCHGKSGGQNGFRLSLLGFLPEDDFEYLRMEARGRRIFPAIPAESLLLKKASGLSPHGGGKRMTTDSDEYSLLKQWIAQGMPFGDADDPVVQSIQCVPQARVMKPKSRQQLRLIATYSDGSQADVTRMALFESNDGEMAECTEGGLVVTSTASGEVAIMARFQGHVATFRATIPLGADTSNMPEPTNTIDEAVFNKLTLLGIPPSGFVDDGTFLRRVTLDITGRFPTEQQVREFAEDAAPDKRSRLIDRLLDTPEYADLFANKWNFILRNNKDRGEDTSGTYLFHQWIWQSLYDNKPYDQFVSEIITATGDPVINPAVTWYRDVDSTEEQVEDTAQLFLGMRIQCARCHHHPFETWSQDDYYSLAAYFSRIGRKGIPNAAPNMRDRRLFHNEGVASARNPRSGRSLSPSAPGELRTTAIEAVVDPRLKLAAWMRSPHNPLFARALVNRYWKHFFSRGIVEPEDDMRATNPPSNPELLDALADGFVQSGFDLKQLIRTICLSRSYQMSSTPNEWNEDDKQNYSRYYARRLSAEVLFDAFHTVNGTKPEFGGLPKGMAAMQLADSSLGPYFLQVFGQPKGDTACECERSIDANLAQSLHLLNGKPIQATIARDDALAAQLAKDSASPEDKLDSLYRRVFARLPNVDEKQISLSHLARFSDEPRRAWEDLVWALINTKEFQFNH
jgi:Protein of unknown function (DUF1549)/Protein of unknown function (DUF1553)